MTRENAIEELKDFQLDVGSCYDDANCAPLYYALDMAIEALRKEPILDKIRAEIDRQEKWLLQAGCTAYNVDIAFDAIKSAVTESE